MIERIEEMPAGTTGFRFSGEVTARDYQEVLIPGLSAMFASGEPVRCLCQMGPEFEGYEASAVWADMKTGARYLGHHENWHRIAVVTDVEWVRHLMGLFGWMSPGEVQLFALDDLEAAKVWVAG